MAFNDSLIFPEKISFGAQGGPTWITQMTTTGGGLEYRNQPNANSLAVWNVGHAARDEATFSILANFFWRCRGRFKAFRYKDWTDYTVAQNGGVSGFQMLTATTFQCYKVYAGVGSPVFERKIQKLYGNFASSGGTFASVDKNTGIVTMSSGTPTTWDSTFHVPMRFDIDDAGFDIINRNVAEGLILGWQSIPLKEVRV